MIARTALILAATCAVGAADFIRSGQATAEWWTSSLAYRPGEPVETALRLTVDEGWHTYWSNPGEGGMKLSVEFDLPDGWEATPPAHPVPKRFKTGGLAGFGYEGEVLFPITLTPPEDASGPVTLKAKTSWLTCDDSACVAGDAELTVSLTKGKPADTAVARFIDAARQLVPRPLEGAGLEVEENGDELTFTLSLPENAGIDPAAADVFPATPEVVDSAATIRFEKSGDHWAATAPKSEYANGPLEKLTLVLAAEKSAPIEVTWKAD